MNTILLQKMGLRLGISYKQKKERHLINETYYGYKSIHVEIRHTRENNVERHAC